MFDDLKVKNSIQSKQPLQLNMEGGETPWFGIHFIKSAFTP